MKLKESSVGGGNWGGGGDLLMIETIGTNNFQSPVLIIIEKGGRFWGGGKAAFIQRQEVQNGWN